MSYNLYFGRFLWAFLFLEDPIPQLANVEQLPCFTEGQDGYFVRALGYSKVAVVIVVTAILVSCTVCTCCPLQTCRVQYSKLRTSVQRFRRTYVLKGSLLNGIFSLYVLMFGLILKTSFNLLAIGKIYYFLAIILALRVLKSCSLFLFLDSLVIKVTLLAIISRML